MHIPNIKELGLNETVHAEATAGENVIVLWAEGRKTAEY
jgi:hypothetical protein